MDALDSFAIFMSRRTLAAACVLGGWAAASAAATGTFAPPPFGHYQPILDRMPFGALPANFGQVPADPAAAQTAAQVQAEQQKLAKQVNMSAVNITPEGKTAIGFTDLSAKPPVNYFLLVGASADGWTVVSADYDDEVATLEKEGVTITLQLGKGLIDPASLPARAAPPSLLPAAPSALSTALPQPAALPAVPGLLRRSTPSSGSGKGPTGWGKVQEAPAAAPAPADAPAADANGEIRSYKERLLERKTQQTEAEIAAARQQQEQLVKLAREAAMKEIARREAEAAQAAAEAAPAAEPAMEAQPQEAPLQEGTVP